MRRLLRSLLPLLLCLSFLVSVSASAEETGGFLDEEKLQSYIEQYMSSHGINPEHLSVGFVYTATPGTTTPISGTTARAFTRCRS